MTVADQMNKMILKNCMKYKGLNVKAAEFVPQGEPVQIVSDKIDIVFDDATFDRLEDDFVNRNMYMFE